MCALLALLIALAASPEQRPATTPLEKAVVEYRSGNLNAALDILDKAIPEQPSSADLYLLRGDIYSVRGESSKAVENYSSVIERRPDFAPPYYRRAMEYFRMTKMADSVRDFDKLIDLHPEQAPNLWQRGISLYYSGDFEKGRKQFESHQNVNGKDVENAVWHFLCVAKHENFEKARAQLIPITGDTRVPMMEVHQLFAGKASADDVLKAAEAGSPPAEELKNRLFYAHLYLALYEEANGKPEASLQHIRKAAVDFRQKHYMGDVARVHLALREKK